MHPVGSRQQRLGRLVCVLGQKSELENNATWATGRKERHVHEKNRRDEREVKKQEAQGTRRRQKERAWGDSRVSRSAEHAPGKRQGRCQDAGGLEMKHLEAPGRKSIWRHPNKKRKSCFRASSGERELGSRFRSGESGPHRATAFNPWGRTSATALLQKSCTIPSPRSRAGMLLSVFPTSEAGGGGEEETPLCASRAFTSAL